MMYVYVAILLVRQPILKAPARTHVVWEMGIGPL